MGAVEAMAGSDACVRLRALVPGTPITEIRRPQCLSDHRLCCRNPFYAHAETVAACVDPWYGWTVIVDPESVFAYNLCATAFAPGHVDDLYAPDTDDRGDGPAPGATLIIAERPFEVVETEKVHVRVDVSWSAKHVAVAVRGAHVRCQTDLMALLAALNAALPSTAWRLHVRTCMREIMAWGRACEDGDPGDATMIRELHCGMMEIPAKVKSSVRFNFSNVHAAWLEGVRERALYAGMYRWAAGVVRRRVLANLCEIKRKLWHPHGRLMRRRFSCPRTYA